jgi:hypothetical protein
MTENRRDRNVAPTLTEHLQANIRLSDAATRFNSTMLVQLKSRRPMAPAIATHNRQVTFDKIATSPSSRSAPPPYLDIVVS